VKIKLNKRLEAVAHTGRRTRIGQWAIFDDAKRRRNNKSNNYFYVYSFSGAVLTFGSKVGGFLIVIFGELNVRRKEILSNALGNFSNKQFLKIVFNSDGVSNGI